MEITMVKNISLETTIKNIWKENGFTYDYHINDNGTIDVEVIWGDWKHDHRYMQYIMEQNGFYCLMRSVTETDGSDSYSADYIFYKRKNFN